MTDESCLQSRKWKDGFEYVHSWCYLIYLIYNVAPCFILFRWWLNEGRICLQLCQATQNSFRRHLWECPAAVSCSHGFKSTEIVETYLLLFVMKNLNSSAYRQIPLNQPLARFFSNVTRSQSIQHRYLQFCWIISCCICFQQSHQRFSAKMVGPMQNQETGDSVKPMKTYISSWLDMMSYTC